MILDDSNQKGFVVARHKGYYIFASSKKPLKIDWVEIKHSKKLQLPKVGRASVSYVVKKHKEDLKEAKEEIEQDAKKS